MEGINLQKIKTGDNLIPKLIRNAHNILEIGCGAKPVWWYKLVTANQFLTAIDIYNRKMLKMKNYTFVILDAISLNQFNNTVKLTIYQNRRKQEEIVDWRKKFDLVIADHVFEHVNKPEKLAKGLSIVTKKDSYVHIGIPDPLNFTERFYHLIHPEGGGHISKITKRKMIGMMKNNGFSLVKYQDWPDDWQWLKKLYNWKERGIKYFSKKELNYIADTFIKEMTSEKGYFYGGEYVFRKE